MVRRVLVWRVLPVFAAIVVSAVALVVGGRATVAADGPQRLPDLVQVTPTDLVLTRAGVAHVLPTCSGSAPR